MAAKNKPVDQVAAPGPRHRRRAGRVGRCTTGDHSSATPAAASEKPERRSSTRGTPTRRSWRSSSSSRSSEKGPDQHGYFPIWVHAEALDGKVASITLELLAKARELGGTVEAFYGGADAEASPGRSAPTARPPSMPPGDLGGTLLGGRSPPLWLPRSKPAKDPTSSCSGPPPTGVTSPAGSRRRSTARCCPTTSTWRLTADKSSPRRRCSVARRTSPPTLDGDGAGHRAGPAEVVRGSRVRRRRGDRRRSSRCPADALGGAKVTDRHVEESTGPKLDEAAVVVSGGRGLGDADKYEMIETLAKLLGGAPGCQPGDRRRRLGALRLPGRPDRQGREADGLHGLRHLGCDPAPGRHEGLEEHHRGQQGRGGADLRSRRPRHRGRRPQGAAQVDRSAPSRAAARRSSFKRGARDSGDRSGRGGTSPRPGCRAPRVQQRRRARTGRAGRRAGSGSPVSSSAATSSSSSRPRWARRRSPRSPCAA